MFLSVMHIKQKLQTTFYDDLLAFLLTFILNGMGSAALEMKMMCNIDNFLAMNEERCYVFHF